MTSAPNRLCDVACLAVVAGEVCQRVHHGGLFGVVQLQHLDRLGAHRDRRDRLTCRLVKAVQRLWRHRVHGRRAARPRRLEEGDLVAAAP